MKLSPFDHCQATKMTVSHDQPNNLTYRCFCVTDIKRLYCQGKYSVQMHGKGPDAFLWVSLWQKYREEGVLQFDWKRREMWSNDEK